MIFLDGAKNRSFNLLTLLLGLYLCASVVWPSLADLFISCIFLVSVFGIKKSLSYFKSTPLSAYEKWFLASFAIYSIISIVSFLYWPSTRKSSMRLEDDLKLLLLIPFYLSIRQYDFKLNRLLSIFIFVSFLLGFVSITQYIGMSFYGEYLLKLEEGMRVHWLRPSGSVNPMRYAVVALVFSGVVACAVILKDRSCNARWLIILGAILALFACVLTQTRGVWLAIPVVMLLLFIAIAKEKSRSVILIISSILVVSIFSLSQLDVVQKRVEVTVKSIEQFRSGWTHTSFGSRVDQFEFSWSLIKENPVWGHGLGVYKSKAQEARKAGELEGVSTEVGIRNTPHNEFLQSMVERGVIGLITVLSIFLIPACIFFRFLNSSEASIRYYSLSGLVVLSVFFIAGQSGTIFNHNVFTHFYVVMLMLLISQIRVRDLDV